MTQHRDVGREKWLARKRRELVREIEAIERISYSGDGLSSEEQTFLLERKRDEAVRSSVLQLHAATEDLLTVWLKSRLLGGPPDRRARHPRARLADDLLTGARSIGFDRKVQLMQTLGMIQRPDAKRLVELNQLRNKVSHHWLLKQPIRRGIKPHLPKRPLLAFRGGNLYQVKTLESFAGEFWRLYLKLFMKTYAD